MYYSRITMLTRPIPESIFCSAPEAILLPHWLGHLSEGSLTWLTDQSAQRLIKWHAPFACTVNSLREVLPG